MTGTHAIAAPAAGAAEIGAQAAVWLIGVATLVTLSLAFDARLAVYAEGLPPEAVTWGRFLSDLGLSGYMFAISGVMVVGALVLRSKVRSPAAEASLTVIAERAAYIFATLSVSGLAAQFIKHIVGRARPRLFQAFGPYHFDFLSMKNELASFPSGHAATVFAMALALSLLAPRLRVALFTLACGIAASRIVVQAHYFSDIIAGGVLGILSARLVARFFAQRGIAFVAAGPGFGLRDAAAAAGVLRA